MGIATYTSFPVVITAVELMLDRYDRRISDRYKLIDYRERDNKREVVSLSNYMLEVTLPVALGTLIGIGNMFQ